MGDAVKHRFNYVVDGVEVTLCAKGLSENEWNLLGSMVVQWLANPSVPVKKESK